MLPVTGSTVSSKAPDLAPLIEEWFLFEPKEDSYALEVAAGELPPWLEGDYYINGPAGFEKHGLRYQHWLDGDGMLCRLHFEKGRVQFTNRFVRTRKYREEEAAGRPLYRAFGTSFEGDQLRRGIMLEPPANVSVYQHGGALLAFSEQALPMQVDPLTLETLGQYDFQGRLNDASPFAAHPKFDPRNGNMLDFGISLSSTKPALCIYEFDPTGQLLHRQRVRLAAPFSNHDFAISKNFSLFFLSPLLMDFQRFWKQGASVMGSLNWDSSQPSRIVAKPRGTRAGEAIEILIEGGHCLHLINAFERAGKLMLDALWLEKPVYREYQPVPSLYRTKGPARPIRYVIDPTRRTLEKTVEISFEQGADFPSVRPDQVSRSYQDFWMLGISKTGKPGRKFFDQLVHMNWSEPDRIDLFQTPEGEYLCGEPVFLGSRDSGQLGLTIIQHFQASSGQVSFLLFDALRIKDGPVARLPLQHRIHPGFHATFEPA